MGTKRIYKPWTKSDITYLIKHIPKKEGDYRRIGKILGRSTESVRWECRKLHLEGVRDNSQSQRINVPLEDRIYELLKNSRGHSVSELTDIFDVGVSKIQDALATLQSRKILLNVANDKISLGKSIKPPEPIKIPVKLYHNRWIKFGVISDTHLNSKYQRLDILNHAYDIFEEEGIKNVFHAGNIIDGYGSLNQFDVFNVGTDEQVNYLINTYPRREGITTHFITADDHEGWIVKREHINIGELIEMKAKAAGRNDLHHLGYIEADVLIKAGKKPTRIRLFHPGGGSAYSLSYKPQKIVESLQGGDKPDILIVGHYHKVGDFMWRNVHIVLAGCFPANVRVSTENGRKRINQIKVGEKVLTDDGSFKKVTKIFKRDYTDDYIAINYGRKNSPDNIVTCTKEHPIKVWRDGQISFVRADEVTTDDWVFVRATKCKVCGKPIPFWMNMCNECNPMYIKKNRDKLSKVKGGFKKVRAHSGSGNIHLRRDIIPFCQKMQKKGWQIVPVGADVIPDAVGFKDGKVIAFELEKQRGNHLMYKKKKYNNAPINNFINGVKWIDLKEHKKQPRTEYKPYNDDFVLVKVLSVKTKKIKTKKVYNLEVEGNHTYVAGHICVHNCTEDQTPFMRKKNLAAHLGFYIIKVHIAPDGSVNRFIPELVSYFNKDYYTSKSWEKPAEDFEHPINWFYKW